MFILYIINMTEKEILQKGSKYFMFKKYLEDEYKTYLLKENKTKEDEIRLQLIEELLEKSDTKIVLLSDLLKNINTLLEDYKREYIERVLPYKHVVLPFLDYSFEIYDSSVFISLPEDTSDSVSLELYDPISVKSWGFHDFTGEGIPTIKTFKTKDEAEKFIKNRTSEDIANMSNILHETMLEKIFDTLDFKTRYIFSSRAFNEKNEHIKIGIPFEGMNDYNSLEIEEKLALLDTNDRFKFFNIPSEVQDVIKYMSTIIKPMISFLWEIDGGNCLEISFISDYDKIKSIYELDRDSIKLLIELHR